MANASDTRTVKIVYLDAEGRRFAEHKAEQGFDPIFSAALLRARSRMLATARARQEFERDVYRLGGRKGDA